MTIIKLTPPTPLNSDPNYWNQNFRSKLVFKDNFKLEVETNSKIKMGGIANINQKRENHFLIYEILNLMNGKFYIGQHETTNPYDRYMGSGHYLISAIRKEGLQNFAKIILYDFETYEQMNYCEYLMVQLKDCYPQNVLSYNLMEGSHNGRLSKESIQKANNTKRKHGGISGERNPMYGKKMLDFMSVEAFNEMQKKQKKNAVGGYTKEEWKKHPAEYDAWRSKISASKTGQKLSDETKQKIGKASIGTHWYNNGVVQCKSFECPEGFVPGKIKKKSAIPQLLKSDKPKQKKSTKGMHIYNNGVVQCKSFECPEGFVPGMLSSAKDKIRKSTSIKIRAVIKEIKEKDPQKWKMWRANQGKSHKGTKQAKPRSTLSNETKQKCSIGQLRHFEQMSPERREEIRQIKKLSLERRYFRMYLLRLLHIMIVCKVFAENYNL